MKGGSFDWSTLVDRDGRTGPARFDAQYWRANTSPWERYVLTPAGSVEHRLPSGDSGFENLVLAGDWTDNGINGSCGTSDLGDGRRARAVTGEAREVPGKSMTWLRPQPRELPAYVEFGGRATAPSPFACEGGRLRGLLLQGDGPSIATLVERMFNVPAGRGVEYRALGSNVMMLAGNFRRVTSFGLRPSTAGDRCARPRRRSGCPSWRAATWAMCSWRSDCCWRCRTSWSTTRCRTWAGARRSATRRSWGASTPPAAWVTA